MKKVALTLASIAAIATFAPEASALPVFARQVGMACSACHFQHFPLLNGFGRSFKANGFTMMGSEPVIEGDNNLKIPDRLNMAVFATTMWNSQSGDQGGLGSTNRRWNVPASGGELSIFYGGRVSEFAGFLSELALTGAGGAASTNSAKLPVLFPVGDARVGLVSYTTNGAGAAYSFEYLNTGGVQNHKMMANGGVNNEHVGTAYASQYMGTATAATGLSIVANNSMGFVNVGKYAAAGAGTATASDLPLTYARIAATFDFAGFDTAVGVQHYDGTQASFAGANTASSNLNVVDAQLQGEMGGMETGLYLSYGVAPADVNGNTLVGSSSGLRTAAGALVSNVNTAATSLNVAASVEVVKAATVQLAVRKATFTPVTGTASDDNSVMIGATYELAMNFGLGINYTTQSGSGWDNYAKATGKDAVGKTMTTVLLETAF